MAENLDTIGQPNTCGYDTSHPTLDWIIGENAPANSVDDANGKCGFDPGTTCTSIINQSFNIGNCTTPTNTITFTMTSGVGNVTRSDSGGQ